MNIYLIVLFIPVFQTQAYWKLKWIDQFNNKSIDSSKWDVTNETQGCDGNLIHQLHCKTSNSRNLWLIDGTLAIAAVPETKKYLDKDFTSALITTKEGFTFGKFEIRAALPKGKKLRPAIYLVPAIKNKGWPFDGQIDLMTNNQTQSLGNGIHSTLLYYGDDFKAGPQLNLNHFHSYILEWNRTTIIWKLDEIQRLSINLTKYFANITNPFIKPFKLIVSLGVGGPFFNTQGTLTKDDVSKWSCSLLILDYIRIYDWIEGNETINERDFNANNTSNKPDSICKNIMPLIRLKKEFDITLILVSTLSLILLLALILIAIYLYNLRKKWKLKQNNNNDHEYYDNNQTQDYYEDINQENEYTEPYQYSYNYLSPPPLYLEIIGK